METRIIYITDDGREFEDSFQAKRHECDITSHDWEYYNERMSMQKQMDENSKIRFCKKCSKQETLR